MRIAVTGHKARVLQAAGLTNIRQTLDATLDSLPQGTDLCMGLATGTDSEVAQLALDKGIGTHVILPYLPQTYTKRENFDDAEFQVFRKLLHEALTLEISSEPSHAAAGCRMLQQSDALLAVWDGAPARGPGGTGHMVASARNMGLPVIWINLHGTRRIITSEADQHSPLTDCLNSL